MGLAHKLGGPHTPIFSGSIVVCRVLRVGARGRTKQKSCPMDVTLEARTLNYLRLLSPWLVYEVVSPLYISHFLEIEERRRIS